MSFTNPRGEGLQARSGADQRAARQEAFAEKRMAQREAKDADYDGIVERPPSLAARLKRLIKR